MVLARLVSAQLGPAVGVDRARRPHPRPLPSLRERRNRPGPQAREPSFVERTMARSGRRRARGSRCRSPRGISLESRAGRAGGGRRPRLGSEGEAGRRRCRRPQPAACFVTYHPIPVTRPKEPGRRAAGRPWWRLNGSRSCCRAPRSQASGHRQGRSGSSMAGRARGRDLHRAGETRIEIDVRDFVDGDSGQAQGGSPAA